MRTIFESILETSPPPLQQEEYLHPQNPQNENFNTLAQLVDRLGARFQQTDFQIYLVLAAIGLALISNFSFSEH